MYTACITIKDTDLKRILKAEVSEKRSRSMISFGDKEIVIEAKDIIAFKATINGLIKLIEAYERTCKACNTLKNGSQRRTSRKNISTANA